MPYMSQTSRSYQLAEPNTPVTDGTGVASSVVDLDPDALVVLEREQVIDHLEALLALRIVDAAQIDQHLEPTVRLVAQIGQYPHDRAGLDQEGQLAADHGAAAEHVAQRRSDLVEQLTQRVGALGDGHDGHGALTRRRSPLPDQRSIVPVRRIFRCSKRTP